MLLLRVAIKPEFYNGVYGAQLPASLWDEHKQQAT